MIWILLGGIVALLFYYMYVKPLRYWQERGVKQTNPIAFFGDSFSTAFRTKSVVDMFSEVYNLHPKSRYSGFYQFTSPTLMLRDPELIKQITIKDFDYFTDHVGFNVDPEADPLWAKNLFFLKGKPWREMRATLSVSFTSSKMKQMFGLMKEASEEFLQHFIRIEEKIIEVEMKNIFSRFANDVIATTAFGVKVNSLENENNEFYLMGKDISDFTGFWMNVKFIVLLLFPTLSKFFKIAILSGPVRTFFPRLINDTIKTREEKGIFRPDMINLLMEARKGNFKHEEQGVIDYGIAVAQESEIEFVVKTQKNITNEDITAQALIFFLGGFDTASDAMCFIAYELALNPGIQKRLREEIKKTASECKENVTYEALLKMKYMDMVISEALRKWPSMVIFDRECRKPYTIQPLHSDENPVHLNPGDEIIIPVFQIHRNPEYYPVPEKFDPERFSDENKDSIQPYTYIPFGVGPRNCIGSRFALLEIKVVFFNLLSNFEIVPTEKSQIPIKLSKKVMSIGAENGFWFGLKRI